MSDPPTPRLRHVSSRDPYIMEKVFGESPVEEPRYKFCPSDLAALESLRNTQKQKRGKYFAYVIGCLVAALAAFEAIRLGMNLVRTTQPGVIIIDNLRAITTSVGITEEVDSEGLVWSQKTPKESGFALWAYRGTESCGGKDRSMMMKGTAAPGRCFPTKVDFDSVRMFNGVPGKAEFGVCMYSGSECHMGSTPLNQQPIYQCGNFNSSQVGSFMITWGTVGGGCP